MTPSFNGCTGETENFSITVEPKPTVFPNPSQEWCSGDNTDPILFDGNFGPAGATYNWTNDNITIGLQLQDQAIYFLLWLRILLRMYKQLQSQLFQH